MLLFGMTNPIIGFVKSYLKKHLHLDCCEPFEQSEMFDNDVCLFVSLESDGFVRGVAGDFLRKEPLRKALERASFSAAFSDDRFSPLKPEEFARLKIFVTLVNPDDIMNSVVIES